MRRLTRLRSNPLTFVACVILLAAVALIILYSKSPDRSQIESDVASRLVELLLILLVGSVVNEAFKARERRQQDADNHAAFREDIRKRLSGSYKATKRSRSMLRVAGITPQSISSGLDLCDSDILSAYRLQMESINEIQLDLEKLWHELFSFRDSFTKSQAIIRRIQVMSGYLRQLLDEYEFNCLALMREGSTKFEKLNELVASTAKSKFREKFCDMYSKAVEAIRYDSLRQRTEKT